MFRRNLVCFGNELKQDDDLAKVGVEGSSPFARSKKTAPDKRFWQFYARAWRALGWLGSTGGPRSIEWRSRIFNRKDGAARHDSRGRAFFART
jgi:hypothetical protein